MTAFARRSFSWEAGNLLTGVYIDWMNSNADFSAVNLASDSVTLDVTLNLFTVGLSTATGGKIDAAGGPYAFKWYLSYMNGAIYNEAVVDSTKAFDNVLVTFNIAVTDTAVGADTVAATLTTIDDRYCSDALCATVATDTANSYTDVSTNSEMCSELWTVVTENDSVSKQCTKFNF